MRGFLLILVMIAAVITISCVNENIITINTPTPAQTPTVTIPPVASPESTISSVTTTPHIDPEQYWATAYNTVYDSELDGTQTVSTIISGSEFTLKGSFLYGGYGVSMQGIGKTGPGGTCIQHSSSGSSFVHIDDPLEFNDDVQNEYARLGITDFTGFGPLALSSPATSEYYICNRVTGSTNRVLKPWYSIATDPAYIPSGTKGTIIFENDSTHPSGHYAMEFSADDTGGAIVGKHIDIYIGEGNAALDKWYATGGNRYVSIIFQNGTRAS